MINYIIITFLGGEGVLCYRCVAVLVIVFPAVGRDAKASIVRSVDSCHTWKALHPERTTSPVHVQKSTGNIKLTDFQSNVWIDILYILLNFILRTV